MMLGMLRSQKVGAGSQNKAIEGSKRVVQHFDGVRFVRLVELIRFTHWCQQIDECNS